MPECPRCGGPHQNAECPQGPNYVRPDATGAAGEATNTFAAALHQGLQRHFAEQRAAISAGWAAAGAAAREAIRNDAQPSLVAPSSHAQSDTPASSNSFSVPLGRAEAVAEAEAPEGPRLPGERWARYVEANASGANFGGGYEAYCMWEGFVFSRVRRGDATIPWPARRTGNQQTLRWTLKMRRHAWECVPKPPEGSLSREVCERCHGFHNVDMCENAPGVERRRVRARQ